MDKFQVRCVCNVCHATLVHSVGFEAGRQLREVFQAMSERTEAPTCANGCASFKDFHHTHPNANLNCRWVVVNLETGQEHSSEEFARLVL